MQCQRGTNISYSRRLRGNTHTRADYYNPLPTLRLIMVYFVFFCVVPPMVADLTVTNNAIECATTVEVLVEWTDVDFNVVSCWTLHYVYCT